MVIEVFLVTRLCIGIKQCSLNRPFLDHILMSLLSLNYNICYFKCRIRYFNFSKMALVNRIALKERTKLEFSSKPKILS